MKPLILRKKQPATSTSRRVRPIKPKMNAEVQSVMRKSSRQVIECINLVPAQRNVATMCQVIGHDKSVGCSPRTADQATQTEELQKEVVIVPVPVYVPLPLFTYSAPFPVPFPFPLPIPVPILIPVNSKTATGILKEIQNLKEAFPADPSEAEVIMIADDPPTEDSLKKEIPEGEKLELDEVPLRELETPKLLHEATEDSEQGPSTTSIIRDDKEETEQIVQNHQQMAAGRKRSGDSPNGTKKKQKQDTVKEIEVSATSQPPQSESVEKVAGQMCLQYMLGINSWTHWILLRNARLELSLPSPKLFNSEILLLSPEELNNALCLFVKEVRKPNGLEYSPDTIYYLCLCIQMYLSKNNRTDNIFYDAYYKEFTECLDENAKKFSSLYSDSSYIVTRVREEHLWECKQLGAHSPYVLLNTIMYINTKYFNLGTIKDHMKLSFVTVLKYWKRNFKQLEANMVAVKKNCETDSTLSEEQPKYLVNPIKLYEFYLSKCPDIVKPRSDVFYLLPEGHCTSDSPVWFTTIPLPQNTMQKMFHRIKFVKEINVALSYN